ncbi:hypothetical protein H310_11806 [Aphanomyces invadans]|uniref:EF-hand domain-containing protein n=1 Tax=Aphanomyces invadans TaxID=157072 RepID=A0A024TMD6_9STRA|nr:hypothetical protein H310_11806 [Aphanomyces invadans]ETV94487.1 hypothetical protein H310_11806 [Aphanomyces invadans]|eukprot:XP_008876802.1 hypothetical protein H310_11806 [Aphanomyces invadans]
MSSSGGRDGEGEPVAAPYAALGTPSTSATAEDVVQAVPAPVPVPTTAPGGVVRISVDPIPEEAWVPAGALPRFTYQDAQHMEWDFSNLTKKDVQRPSRAMSARNESKNNVSHSIRMSSEFGDGETKEDLSVLLDPFYDVTTGRLRRLFQHFSPKGSETVTYDEFQHGLLALGISVPAGSSFRDFVRKVDTNGDGSISVGEFIHVVQMIKQAHLFKPEHAQAPDEHVLRVVDYSPTNLHAVNPVTKLQSFMFSTKPQWAKVRWVHLAGFKRADDLNLRRLAIKYQLHPLALEDCLNQNDKIRCKFEHYDDHSFLVLPVLRPLHADKARHIQECIAEHRRDVFNKRQALLKDDGTPTKQQSPTKDVLAAKLNELKVMMREPEQLCVFLTKDGNILSVQEEIDTPSSSATDAPSSAFPLWDLVFDHNMAKSYSKLRSHDGNFLVVSLLNAVVEEMMPLVEVFEAKFDFQGQLLRVEGTKFDTKRFSRAKKQLIAIEKTVRPLLDLVQDQLLDQDEFNRGEVKNYLRDVKDHLKQMAAELREHQQTLAALVEEQKRISAKAQADVMYAMSVIAACFLPGTFMTGIYGMNFDNMPELHWEYGYVAWWVVLITIITGLLAFLKFVKGWI